jgi:glycosyltransferase involved in cell wall biosynthesis
MPASFITWYPYCRRSDTIAAALEGRSHLIHYLTFKRPLHAPFKYVLQSIKSLQILLRERPAVVLVAVPPIFAALPVLLYARLVRGTKVVIDAHTGIFDHARWTWLAPLTRAVFRQADAVIVTGEHLRGIVESWGARAIVIGDVPVEFVGGQAPAPCDGARVVVVNTFSVDEPVGEVLATARRLRNVQFFVTGDVRHARREWIDEKPENLTFTGFVSEEEYAGLLRAADTVVVLTTRDHTMQRGGYEAMALSKPLVTSDWQLLRETFSKGTVHVHNTDEEIAAGIRNALELKESLSLAMRGLRDERHELFTVRLCELRAILGIADPEPPPVALSATGT